MSDSLTLRVTDQDGTEHTVPALNGWRVMEIIRDNNLPIRAECGGSGTCATCHVYIDPEWMFKIPAPHNDELDQLDTLHGYDPKRSRLSCQIIMDEELDAMHVTLAPGSEP